MVKQNKETGAEDLISRRSFLGTLWAALGFVALIEFLAVGVAFLKPRKSTAYKEGFGGMITAGPLDKFANNSVTAFREGQFYLARLQDGGFLALSRRCTHLGCTVPWDEEEKKFKCPCHASAFDITGNVINPPAPRALDTYPVKIENNIVKVDTSRPIRRKQFNKSQVVYL
jgi:cytochrome b6-f complex iron-sulfur subunit